MAVESLKVVARGSLADEIRASGTVAGDPGGLRGLRDPGPREERDPSGWGTGSAEGPELLRVDDRIAALNLDRAKEQLRGGPSGAGGHGKAGRRGPGCPGGPDPGPGQRQRGQGPVRDGPKGLQRHPAPGAHLRGRSPPRTKWPPSAQP
ncbi:MAG: hypothetical protein MZV70_35125 [Desulfobacterales bacterium]|nr:hypothetical protein [Desulfobacterales bacterium]